MFDWKKLPKLVVILFMASLNTWSGLDCDDLNFWLRDLIDVGDVIDFFCVCICCNFVAIDNNFVTSKSGICWINCIHCENDDVNIKFFL